MEFDPLTGKLFSGSKGEFILSSFDEKKIERNSYKGKILCCSWSPDGQFLAFGTLEGLVSIRTKDMAEMVIIPIFTLTNHPKTVIKRPESVWCLKFSPVTP